MSKIQKAIGRLSQSGVQKVDSGSNTVIRKRSGLPSRRYEVSGNGESEHAPDQFIEVSDEALVEQMFLQVGPGKEQLAQQFRRIKRPILNIAFGELGKDARNSNVIMVASALPKSGKTFCSFNLAQSIAIERDIGAVLVDADVLKPNISRVLQIEDRIGLIDYLLNPQISLDDILLGTNMQDVIVVPAGQRHDEATELLASRRMEEFVSDLSRRFETRAIVVDTPPLLLTNEAHVLAEHMGQIVFIIEAGVTSQESVIAALDSLNRDKPINAVMNKARGSDFGAGYGGGYYGYYVVANE